MRLVWWMSRFALMKTFIALETEERRSLSRENKQAAVAPQTSTHSLSIFEVCFEGVAETFRIFHKLLFLVLQGLDKK